jgi:hypothetical protein
LDGQIHDTGNLSAMNFPDRSTHHRKVLSEEINWLAVNRTFTGYDAISKFRGFPVSVRSLWTGGEEANFLKRAFIEKKANPFPRSALSFVMLLLDAKITSAKESSISKLFQ